jgi:hypothetical protein
LRTETRSGSPMRTGGGVFGLEIDHTEIDLTGKAQHYSRIRASCSAKGQQRSSNDGK